MFAVLIGYPCFRLSGVYYSLSTVALVNVMRLFFIAEDTIFGFETGSSLGYKLPWFGESLVNMEFLDKKYYFWIILALLCVVVIVSTHIKRSKTGYYLSAINTNQSAARSLGIIRRTISSSLCSSAPFLRRWAARFTRCLSSTLILRRSLAMMYLWR